MTDRMTDQHIDSLLRVMPPRLAYTLMTLLDGLVSVNDRNSLKGWLHALRLLAPCDGMALAIATTDKPTKILHLVNIDFDEDWLKRYMIAGYERKDPVLAAPGSASPVIWSEHVASRIGAEAGLKRFVEDAIEFGMTRGLSVISEMEGLKVVLSLAGENPEANDETRSVLAFLNRHIATTAISVLCSDRTSELSEREHDVFRLMVAGLSQKEIAASLGLNERTIRMHIQRMKARIGARHRHQLVAMVLTPQK